MKIVILGGGTAGWMCAAQFAHRWVARGYDITVVDSSTIGTVGVGEGTTPSMKQFLDEINVSEKEWMSECNATYKSGIRFNHWSSVPGFNSYFHPFYSDIDREVEPSFIFNTRLRRQGVAVDAHPDHFFMTTELANQYRSPVASHKNQLLSEYAYHFDAGLFGAFLKKKSLSFGATHLDAKVESVTLDDNGNIEALIFENGQKLEADFFVDCSGFRALLIQKTLQAPFKSYSDHLLNDSAVTLPTEPALTDIPAETVSTALKHGWAWRIPLTNRFGNGYVYSSAHTTAEEAEIELKQQLGLSIESDIPANHLKMRLGRLEKNWVKNCLAIGLSQGFIEPLEATALHFVGKSIINFMDVFDQGGGTDQFRSAYNRKIASSFDHIRDYILLHYRTNTREDSSYWRDARSVGETSDSLLNIITCWMQNGDLSAEISRQGIGEFYNTASWHCMFAGVGVLPDINHCRTPKPEQLIIDLQAHHERILKELQRYPSHREGLQCQ